MKLSGYALHPALRDALAVLALTLYSGAGVAQSVTLPHVHGLTYSADGKRLIVAVHDGLAIYNAGRWSKDPGPRHDYMGFTATQKRFYSSGHPAPGSGLTNPLGLIVSGDGGRTWEKRGFEGESDFHTLGASYETNAIYVHNPGRNSRMDRPGIYYTLNDGFTWTRAQAQGLTSAVHAIAVHPSKPQTVAVAAKEGLFLSTDSGERFERLAAGQALAAFFELGGEHLVYSMHDGAARLYRHSLKSRSRTEIPLPPLTQDAVSYIAQNPADKSEYAIATFERSVFLSKNTGKNWTQIARNGQAK
ncbi:MAG: glycosyl hydrolase [Betaproteobacteria bacterium]|nr:glycosyl hydrolase [Betaproteobacteria bacterium]